jgi:hypothetical protein
VRLKNRAKRLEGQLRELRCAWCSFSLADIPPPLPFLPQTENHDAVVFACCWRCGARFSVGGVSLRERQLNALFSSTPPAKAYTDERARAVSSYLVRRYILSRKVAAKESKNKDENYHKGYRRQEQERQLKKTLRDSMSPAARAKLALRHRAQVEAQANYEKLNKRFGDAPRDMDEKTFAELEIIIFGDASDEAHQLDARVAEVESGATETV